MKNLHYNRTKQNRIEFHCKSVPGVLLVVLQFWTAVVWLVAPLQLVSKTLCSLSDCCRSVQGAMVQCTRRPPMQSKAMWEASCLGRKPILSGLLVRRSLLPGPYRSFLHWLQVTCSVLMAFALALEGSVALLEKPVNVVFVIDIFLSRQTMEVAISIGSVPRVSLSLRQLPPLSNLSSLPLKHTLNAMVTLK